MISVQFFLAKFLSTYDPSKLILDLLDNIHLEMVTFRDSFSVIPTLLEKEEEETSLLLVTPHSDNSVVSSLGKNV